MEEIKVPDFHELVFMEQEHKYLLEGAEIPSVTQVMEMLSQHEYSSVNEATLMRAANRGTKVHNAIENYLKYGLDDCPEELRGYMDGFLEWWGERNPTLIGSEVRIYHPIFRYAGTIDLIAEIDGKVNLVDFKTTYKLIDKNCRVQLEAYAQALQAHGVKVEEKHILHLGKDGKWKAPEYEAKDAEAWRVFTSLICVRNYIEA